MVQEITAGHTANEGRPIANANHLELFERAEALSARKRVILAEDVDGAPIFNQLYGTGLAFPVEADKMYRFEAKILFSVSATTGGIAIATRGPTSGGSNNFATVQANWPDGDGTLHRWMYSGYSGTIATQSSLPGISIATLYGLFRDPLSGEFEITFYASTTSGPNSTVATVHAGSTLEYW